MKGLLSLILPGLIFCCSSAQAMCWHQAAEKYRIEPALLKAIAQVESGMKTNAVNINANGSYDIGLMQINSIHLPELKKKGISEEALLTDACLSVMTGASILQHMINKYGYTWEAVGAYNAGTSAKRRLLRFRYAYKVWQAYEENMR